MVTDRLKNFFGFGPVVALDPDQAVARGAAVYHYYLHKYEEMRDDMKLLGNADSVAFKEHSTKSLLRETKYWDTSKPVIPHMAIQWGSNILNDCLYLGVKNGAVHEIVPTGAELLYTSSVMTGFKVEPGQSMIAIPIKSQNLDGTYRIIANGNISFKKSYNNGAFVAFQIYMGSNKVINMKAWTSKDISGKEKMEEGFAEIVIDNSEKSKIKTKVIAPSGSKLQPKSEINNMLQLCQNYKRCKNKQEKSNIAKSIASCVSSICNAGNKDEFAGSILDTLASVLSEESRQRLFVIARKIGGEWNDSEKRKLAMACMSQISADISGFLTGGPKVSTNIQAILTLSICANMDQLTRLSSLHDYTSYHQACLYTHAKTRSDFRWIQDEFEADVKKAFKSMNSNIQFSSYAIGVALKKRRDRKKYLISKGRGSISRKLMAILSTTRLIPSGIWIIITQLLRPKGRKEQEEL